MKLILCGDLHMGVNEDNPLIQDMQANFIKFMCEYAYENEIRHMLQAGDWFDVRRGISQRTLNLQRERVIPYLDKYFDAVTVLVGNHDMHFKNKIHPNSVTEVLGEYCNVVDKPRTAKFGSTLIDVIPWVCEENEKEVEEFIKNSNSEYAIGHFELAGFEMYKGTVAKGDYDDTLLGKYRKVFSGHYHTSSEKHNVLYLGTPYTLTMGDAGELRGFWVLDTETHDIEFVPFEEGTLHHSLVYSGDFDVSVIKNYAGKFVRLVVERVDNKLDGVLSQFEEVCAYFKHTIVEELTSDVDDDTIETKTVVDVMFEYIDSLDRTKEERDKIKAIAKEAYAIARSGE